MNEDALLKKIEELEKENTSLRYRIETLSICSHKNELIAERRKTIIESISSQIDGLSMYLDKIIK